LLEPSLPFSLPFSPPYFSACCNNLVPPHRPFFNTQVIRTPLTVRPLGFVTPSPPLFPCKCFLSFPLPTHLIPHFLRQASHGLISLGEPMLPRGFDLVLIWLFLFRLFSRFSTQMFLPPNTPINYSTVSPSSPLWYVPPHVKPITTTSGIPPTSLQIPGP